LIKLHFNDWSDENLFWRRSKLTFAKVAKALHANRIRQTILYPFDAKELAVAMPEQEIVRRLRVLRYSPQGPRSRRAAPGLRSIARAAGLSHMTLHRAIRTGKISNKSAAALGKALEGVTFELNQNRRSP
jgi:hypothetical protein